MKFVPERFLLAERASNFKRLVLDGFVAEFSRSPPSITGMLRKPTDRVRRMLIQVWTASNSFGKRFPIPAVRE
jgi:hypothetical protein